MMGNLNYPEAFVQVIVSLEQSEKRKIPKIQGNQFLLSPSPLKRYTKGYELGQNDYLLFTRR